MQELFIYSDTEVCIQTREHQYTDTLDNFKLDCSINIPYNSINYNRTLAQCWLNGSAFQEFPNVLCEEILNSVAGIVDAKISREYVPPAPPTEAEIQAKLTRSVQEHLDSKAQERNYDNIHTACTYINSSDSVFASEASALLLWRDKVWRECYSILDDVKAGRRPIPSVSELLEELPSFSWPDEV